MSKPSTSKLYKNIKGNLSLGLCCINTELRTKTPPVFCSRTCIRRNFTVELAKERALQNVKDISKLINWNNDNGIRCLRLSSDIFPHFTDKQTEKYDIDFAREDLLKAGTLAKKFSHRILMHPGQYNQIGAKSSDVYESTVADLSHHADILDAMGVDCEDGVLIVHGGGTYGDKETTMRRWIDQFSDLPRKVKNRLVLENCERQYSIRDCLSISEECRIPVVFDFHHYDCWNIIKDEDQESIMDLVPEIIESWRDRSVLMHVSEQGEGKIGHHSDYIETIPKEIFQIIDEYGIHIDLEIEAKMKEQAIFKLYNKYPLIFK